MADILKNAVQKAEVKAGGGGSGQSSAASVKSSSGGGSGKQSKSTSSGGGRSSGGGYSQAAGRVSAGVSSGSSSGSGSAYTGRAFQQKSTPGAVAARGKTERTGNAGLLSSSNNIRPDLIAAAMQGDNRALLEVRSNPLWNQAYEDLYAASKKNPEASLAAMGDTYQIYANKQEAANGYNSWLQRTVMDYLDDTSNTDDDYIDSYLNRISRFASEVELPGDLKDWYDEAAAALESRRQINATNRTRQSGAYVYNRAADYLRGGKYDSDTTMTLFNSLLNAQADAVSVGDDYMDQTIRDILPYFQGQLGIENRANITAIEQELNDLKKRQQNIGNQIQATTQFALGLYGDEQSQADLKMLKAKEAELAEAIAEKQGELDRWNGVMTSPMLDAVTARLQNPMIYSDEADAQREADMRELEELSERNENDELNEQELARLQELAARMRTNYYARSAVEAKEQEQAIADIENIRFGRDPQYYNTVDRLRGSVYSAIGGAAGAVAGLAGNVGQNIGAILSDTSASVDGRKGILDKPLTDAGKAVSDVSKKLQDKGIEADAEAQNELAKALNGASTLGKFGLQMVKTAVEMGIDAATGTKLAGMAARVYGNAANTATAQGADLATATKYAGYEMAKEVFTEKVFNGLGSLGVYGKGIGDDAIEYAINRFASSDLGANFMRVIAGGVEEGAEEVLADLLEPFADRILNGKDNWRYADNLSMAETFYSFLLGSAMGLLGQGGAIVNGQYQAMNDEYMNDMSRQVAEAKAEQNQSQRNAESSEAEGTEPAEASAEEEKTDEAEQAIPESMSKGQYQNYMDRLKDRSEKAAKKVVLELKTKQVEQGGLSKDEEKALNAAERILESAKKPSIFKKTDTREGMINRAFERGVGNQRMTEEEERQAVNEVTDLEGEPQEWNPEEANSYADSKRIESEVEAFDKKKAEAERKRREKLAKEPEIAKAEAERISKEIAENDNHLDDGRPRGGGAVLWVPSRNSQSIQELWKKQAERIAKGKKMTRDAEFEAYTDENGKTLTLEEAADAEQHGEKVNRWRSISNVVVDDMKAATKDNPLIVGRTYMGDITTFKFDGTNLHIAHAEQSPEGNIRIKDSSTLPADQFERAAIYLTESLIGTNAYKRGGDLYRSVFDEVDREAAYKAEKKNGQRKAASEPFSAPQVESSEITPGEEEKVVKTNTSPESEAAKAKQNAEDSKEVVDKLRNAISSKKVNVVPVVSIDSSEFQKTEGQKLTDKVGAFFRELGNKVKSRALGGREVIIDEDGVQADIAHGLGRAKAATFKAVPDVIAKGSKIDEQKNWKGRGYDTAIIAAPIQIDQQQSYVACVVSGVQEGGTTRFYLHEVVDGNGNLIYSFDQMNKKTPNADVKTGIAIGDTGTASEVKNSVTQSSETVNNEQSAALPSTTKSGILKSTDTEGDATNGQNLHFRPGWDSGYSESGGIGADNGEGEQTSGRHLRPIYTGEEAELRGEQWETGAKRVKDNGGVIVDQSAAPEEVQELIEVSERITGLPVTVFDATNYNGAFGFTAGGEGCPGFFMPYNPKARLKRGEVKGGAGSTAMHETGHVLFAERGGNLSRQAMADDAVRLAGVSEDGYKSIKRGVLFGYGYNYAKQYGVADKLGVSSQEEWKALTVEERASRFAALDEDAKSFMRRQLFEELCNFYFSADPDYIQYEGFENVVREMRGVYVRAGLVTEDQVNELAQAAAKADSKTREELLAQQSWREVVTPDTTIESADSAEEATQNEPPRAAPPGKRKKSQSAVSEKTQTKRTMEGLDERAKEIADKYGISDGTYFSMKQEDVSRVADHWIEKYGIDNELDRLMKQKDWSRIDFSEAQKIIWKKTEELDRRMSSERGILTDDQLKRKPGETNEEYKERLGRERDSAYKAARGPIDALLLAHTERKSELGQELQEKYRFNTADEVRMRASQRLLNWGANGFVFDSERGKSVKVYRIVDDLLGRIQKAESEGDMDAVSELIKTTSYIRGQQNLLGKLGVKGEKTFLNDLVKSGVSNDALIGLAYGNVNRIIDDLTPVGWMDMVNTIRMSNMLSNIATTVNNVANNAVGIRTGALAQNAGYIFAKPLERATGKVVGVKDSSLRGAILSKEIRSAERLAFEYALLSSYYGISAEEGRLDKAGKQRLSVNRSIGERALATYNFLIQAAVLDPDAMSKARTKAGIQKGINERFDGVDLESNPRAAANKAELESYAKSESERRAFQEDTDFNRLVQHAKEFINKKLHFGSDDIMIGGRRLGTVGLGDFVAPFLKVPVNVATQAVASTPIGAAVFAYQYAKTVAKAKLDPESVSVTEMARASRNMGRAVTSAGMIALGAMAAAMGALKDMDELDDEEKKWASEKGYKGLMLNLSEIFRGGNEWQEDDLILSAGFLEVAALPLSIGAFMYESSLGEDGERGLGVIAEGTKRAFSDVLEKVGDMPMLQQAGQLWQSYTYSNPNDDDFTKMKNAIGEYAASTATTFYMPNLVSQIGAGLDNTRRDIYNTNTYGERLRNIVMSKDPILRRFLPESKDSFGNTRTYGSNRVAALFNTVMLPGDVYVYQKSDLQAELERLNKAGYGTTWLTDAAPTAIDDERLTPAERQAFRETRNAYRVDAFEAFRKSDEYKRLDDQQRLAVYKELRTAANHKAYADYYDENGLEDTTNYSSWEETLDSTKERIEYLSAKQELGAIWNDDENRIEDSAKMDDFMSNTFQTLSDDQQELLTSKYSHVDDIQDARSVGITSEQWQTAYDIYKKYNNKENREYNDETGYGFKATDATQMWADIEKATGANNNQMEWFEDNMRLYNHISADNSHYQDLTDAGWSRETSNHLVQDVAALQPAEGKKTVSYKQTLTTIAKASYLTEDEKWEAFWEYLPSNYTSISRNFARARSLGTPYDQAVRQLGKWME